MDLLKLFDKSLDIKRKPLRPSNPPSTSSEPISRDLFRPKVLQHSSGKEYVKAYVEEEEKKALQAVKAANFNKNGGKMDEISVGTVPTIANEVDEAEVEKFFGKFGFEHRVKDELPIFNHKAEILSTVQTHSVTVIEGTTGCGKSTQVPQFILDDCRNARKYCNIIVTQPRRIAAVSIASRVAYERNWSLGSIIGCQVGFYKKLSPDTRLTYCTTGILLRKLISAKNMLEYTHIILDEVHERDQEMDFLILVIRKLLRSNSRQVKVILMSATFNVDKFAEYFSIPTDGGLVKAPVISVGKKRPFKIHNHYLCQLTGLGIVPDIFEPKVTDKSIGFCIKLVTIFDDLDKHDEYDPDELEETGGRCRYATLIFLPGIWEIEEVHNQMVTLSEKMKWDIVVLHSHITSEEQHKVFKDPPAGYRRIVLSTNVAESSITIDKIKYVIDFCLTKQLVTDPNTNFQCLELTWASKANCEQRAGRAGRLMDGRVYRLITKKFYESLPDEGEPEIVRAPLESLVLQTKILDMGEPKAVLALAIDPPDLSNLERTILLLKEVGGLLDKPGTFNMTDGELTDLGRIMATMPLDIHLSKLMALGQIFNVLRDTVIIAASLGCKSMFSNPFQQRMDAYNAKVHWADGSSSDCFAYLNAYKVWQREITANRLKRGSPSERNYANRNFIQIKVMHEIDYLVRELTERLANLGIKETMGPNKHCWREGEDDVEHNFILKFVIAGAFYPNYFVRNNASNEHDATYSVRNLGGLEPSRTVYFQGWKIDHPGRLYAKRIQELFKGVITSYDQALVEFDGSTRVYVMFNDDKKYGHEVTQKGIPGKISQSVYKALKMKKLQMDFIIPVLDIKTAKQRAEKYKLPTTSCSMFYSQENYDCIRNCIPVNLPILPSLFDKTLPIKIVNYKNPNKFWVQVQNPDIMEKLHLIKKTLKDLNDDKIFTPLSDSLKIGSLVAAPYDNKMYRAVIESSYKVKNDTAANLFFIDYGFRGSVELAKLKIINPDSKIGMIKALAFEATLKSLQPSLKQNAQGSWTKDAHKLFERYTSNEYKVYGEVYSVVDSIVSFIIKYEDPRMPNHLINLNEIMEHDGLAEYFDEPLLSQRNNETRKKFQEIEQKLKQSDKKPDNKKNELMQQKEYYEYLQYDKNFLISLYPEPPASEECRSIIMLKGPHSPLEVNLSSLAIVAATKKVNIETTSVNSVLLDIKPEDPHERLLVSSIVSQNPSSTNLTLRNTTLMPNLPGLTALICLIFSPKIELRRSEGGTYYIGALCGLGCHPQTKAALLPEHDMEVCFDTEITIEDLQNINRLRHYMNMGICVKNDEIDDLNEQIIHCQNKAIHFFKQLTERPTKALQRQKILNFGYWCLYNETLFMQPTKAAIKDDSIYPLHCGLVLGDRDEQAEKMTAHIQELKRLAMSDPKISEMIEVECELCNKTVYTREDLRLHLFMREHRDKERELNIE